jgi:hypothetical protein
MIDARVNFIVLVVFERVRVLTSGIKESVGDIRDMVLMTE